MAGDLLRLAEEQADPVARVIAHRALANSQFFVGDLLATRTHAEQALASYQAAQRPGLAVRYAADPFVLSAYFSPMRCSAWVISDSARACREGASRARELGHVLTMAQALHTTACFICSPATRWCAGRRTL